MAHAFQRLVEEARTRFALPVQGHGHETWSARSEGSRVAIRASLKTAFADWLPADLVQLEDLSAAPRPFTRSVSVSHTHDFGGWMALARPAQIGWDIELKARISERVITRVCSAGELALAPEKALLWAAKESFYKALEDDQPEVLEQLTIDEWRALEPGLWTFRGLGVRNGEGLLLDSEPWLLGVCVVR